MLAVGKTTFTPVQIGITQTTTMPFAGISSFAGVANTSGGFVMADSANELMIASQLRTNALLRGVFGPVRRSGDR